MHMRHMSWWSWVKLSIHGINVPPNENQQNWHWWHCCGRQKTDQAGRRMFLDTGISYMEEKWNKQTLNTDQRKLSRKHEVKMLSIFMRWFVMQLFRFLYLFSTRSILYKYNIMELNALYWIGNWVTYFHSTGSFTLPGISKSSYLKPTSFMSSTLSTLTSRLRHQGCRDYIVF